MISNNRAKLLVASALSSVLFLTSCAVPPQPGENVVAYNFNQAFNNPNACSHNSRDLGIAVGIVAGALIGLAAKGNAVAAAEGAAAGGVAGFAVGALVDHRRCEAYKVAVANQLEIATATLKASQIGEQSTNGQNSTVGTNMIIQDNGQFEPGSAELTPNAQAGLPQIAQQYNPVTIAAGDSSSPASPSAQTAAEQRTVLVISRTSEDPAITDPAILSSQRARTVAKVMVDSGVPAQNIYYQGAGDSESVVPSSDPSASAANNSTQILDFPNQQAMQTYLNQNAINPPAGVVAANASSAQPATGATTRETEGDAKWTSYDFGGQPVTGTPDVVALGPSQNTPGLSLIASAYASSPMNIKACVLDHPRRAGPVIDYATGQELSVSGVIPGFYGAPWVGGYNGDLVAALHVYVPSDDGRAVPEPTLEIYKNYKNGDSSPNYRKTVPVNVYRSQNKILYRMFIGGPIKCLDLVVNNSTPQGDGTLFYNHNGRLYSADGTLALQH